MGRLYLALAESFVSIASPLQSRKQAVCSGMTSGKENGGYTFHTLGPQAGLIVQSDLILFHSSKSRRRTLEEA